MKLINKLLSLKIQIKNSLTVSYTEFISYLKPLSYLGLFLILVATIWFGGPHLTWQNQTPLLATEKRLYLIFFVFLVGLLKFLLFDTTTTAHESKIPKETQQQLDKLKNRFSGAIQFLKKTVLPKAPQFTHLYQLPLYLLLGPEQAGKTALLTYSNVHFILQKPAPESQQQLKPSESCDWWVTRDAILIDVPGKFASKTDCNPVLWQHFLNLIKKQYGKNGAAGILIAFPLPEILRQHDPKKYQAELDQLIQYLQALNTITTRPIPCQLIITKCDLLTGFSEYFAESSQDELAHALGIMLPHHNNEKIDAIFTQQFDLLIKKINQQLLWRLHQERNPMAKPYIKNFPLQLERLKEITIDFIKKLSTVSAYLSLDSVCLTSALQPVSQTKNVELEATLNTSQRELQIFHAPQAASRPYFIKQLITRGLATSPVHHKPLTPLTQSMRLIAYGAICASVIISTLFFSYDYHEGKNQLNAIHLHLSHYHALTREHLSPDNQLIVTLNLLNSLQHESNESWTPIAILNSLSFYTHQSQKKASILYHKATQTLLLPALKNYLADFMKTPVNRDAEDIYAALKAYLMLADSAHSKPYVIAHTMQHIMPTVFNEAITRHFQDHLQILMTGPRQITSLDTNLIELNRKFLMNMPTLRLSYIILKNTNQENKISVFNPNIASQVILINHPQQFRLPLLYTQDQFTSILTKEIPIAATEALQGNEVLGEDESVATNKNSELAEPLIQQLRTLYIKDYIATWEAFIKNIRLIAPANMIELDQIINQLINEHSPLINLLQIVHTNTYFNPVISQSESLARFGQLLDTSTSSSKQLKKVISALQSLHEYLQIIIKAENQKETAFHILYGRAKHPEANNAILNLRSVANDSPYPINSWLNQLSNQAWHYVMDNASSYLNTAWQEQIIRFYQEHLAKGYPFKLDANQEVEISQFTKFFGVTGIMQNFYVEYLQPFIDTDEEEWEWKKIDAEPLPFSTESLAQIKRASEIKSFFFPNNQSSHLNIQFSLKPYRFSQHIKRVKLKINDKLFIDENIEQKMTHHITWISDNKLTQTHIQINYVDQPPFNQEYAGGWSWIRLITQSYNNVIEGRKVLLNFANKNNVAIYSLTLANNANPLLLTQMSHFYLPDRL